MNLEDYDFDRLLGLGFTEKATGDLKDACWKGYTAIGTKKKGGRTVPNCVPIKKSEHSESDDFRQVQMGGDLLVDVECDTNLPVSTPAELREAKMRKRVVAAQNKAQRQEAREQAKRAREAKRASREAKKMQQGFAEEMKRKPLIAGPSAGSPSFAEGKGTGKPCGDSHISAKKTCKVGQGSVKRDPSKDVKRGNTLIGTSPKNMSIDNLNEVKKEYEDYKKKFGHRPDLKNVMDAYEKRIADAEKAIKEMD